jgi:hypothetical protein
MLSVAFFLTIFIVSATNTNTDDIGGSTSYKTNDGIFFNITATPHRLSDNIAYLTLNITTEERNNKTFILSDETILNNGTLIKFNNTNSSEINTDNFTYFDGMSKILTLKEENTHDNVTLNITFKDSHDANSQITVDLNNADLNNSENVSDIEAMASTPEKSNVVTTSSSNVVTTSSSNTPVYLIISQRLSYFNPQVIKNAGVTHVIINTRCDGITQSRINDFVNVGLRVQFYTPCYYNPDTGRWDMDYNRAKERVFNALDRMNSFSNVDGFVLDYIRSPNAYANNQYLVKNLIIDVRNRYPNKQLSAFIMPESCGTEVYGQNIDWIKPYLNNIMVMAYKGNYNRGSDWIRDINYYFFQKVSGSNCAVVNIVQSYISDNNPVPLSRATLYADMDKGLYGGAYGTGLFRGGLNNLDPNNPYVPRST